MATKAEHATQRAIEIIERLALDAVAALRAQDPRVTTAIIDRAEFVGNAQVGGELAIAVLLACKMHDGPDGLKLHYETDGFNPMREKAAATTVRRIRRRIEDSRP